MTQHLHHSVFHCKIFSLYLCYGRTQLVSCCKSSLYSSLEHHNMIFMILCLKACKNDPVNVYSIGVSAPFNIVKHQNGKNLHWKTLHFNTAIAVLTNYILFISTNKTIIGMSINDHIMAHLFFNFFLT